MKILGFIRHAEHLFKGQYRITCPVRDIDNTIKCLIALLNFGVEQNS